MPSRIATVAGQLVVCLLLLALAALASASDSQPLQIAGSGWVADAPTKIADQLGAFNEPGILPEIKVVNYNSGKEALASLLAGATDFALAASTPVADALLQAASAGERESSFVVLASVSLSNRTHLIVANGAAGIDQPADLVGKRIGVMLDTSGHFGWHKFAEYHGLDAAAITLVDLPVASMTGAVLDGRIDAAAIWQPWADDLQSALGADAKTFSTRHMYTVSWLLVTRRDVLARHPDSAERILKGYLEATALIDADPKHARELHARANNLDPATLEPLEAGIIWSVVLDWSVLADLESQFSWIAERRSLDARSAPAPYHYLYASPLLNVAPSRVTLPYYLHAGQADGAENGATQ
ncbi:MAG TPA: NrtA/SsuA/CpmA family ABC transporter substrate-binding protein [Woeseiaceae bacterium]